MTKPRIMIAAGGTGGHIFPALAVADELREQFEIIWLGAKVGLENTLVPKHGYRLERLPIVGLRNKGLLRKLTIPAVLFISLLKCLWLIAYYRPQAVIGFGGYATFPICLAAKLTFHKMLIHEQNAFPGLSNKILSKFADRVLTGFHGVLASKKTVTVGNPVRKEIIATGAARSYSDAEHTINLLVVGGSLGAKVLNDLVPTAVAGVPELTIKVRHQVGRGDVSSVAKAYRDQQIDAEVSNFIEDMAAAYSAADVIICRAGALTVAEVACAGIAAIFVPYPLAVDDHQTANAQYLVERDAAYLIPQSQLTAASLSAYLNQLTLEKCKSLGINARKHAIIDSTKQICQQIATTIGNK